MNKRGRSINLELTTRCTLGCPRCLRTIHPEIFDVQDMNLVVIDRITDRADLDTISLCGTYGDPIYHRHFHDAVQIMVDKGLDVYVATNGSHRSLKWWEQTVDILSQTNSEITFSVDGLSDTNHLYRVNSKWDHIERAMRYCAPRIKTKWKFIVFKHNQHQIEEAAELARTIGVEFHVVHSQRFGPAYGFTWDNDPLIPDEQYVHKRR